jgi:hypothetical protein
MPRVYCRTNYSTILSSISESEISVSSKPGVSTKSTRCFSDLSLKTEIYFSRRMVEEDWKDISDSVCDFDRTISLARRTRLGVGWIPDGHPIRTASRLKVRGHDILPRFVYVDVGGIMAGVSTDRRSAFASSARSQGG